MGLGLGDGGVQTGRAPEGVESSWVFRLAMARAGAARGTGPARRAWSKRAAACTGLRVQPGGRKRSRAGHGAGSTCVWHARGARGARIGGGPRNLCNQTRIEMARTVKGGPRNLDRDCGSRNLGDQGGRRPQWNSGSSGGAGNWCWCYFRDAARARARLRRLWRGRLRRLPGCVHQQEAGRSEKSSEAGNLRIGAGAG